MKLKALMVGLAVAMLASVPAFASCTDSPGNPGEFCLDTPNNSNIGVGDIVVKIELSGTSLHVVVDSNSTSFTNLDIKEVGFNNTSGNLFVDGSPTGWDAGGAACCDGFSFASWTSNTNEPNGGEKQTDVTFTLSGTPSFDGDQFFAVHLGYDNNGQGCSLWLTNNHDFVPSGESQEGCTSVPEPGSLALLGTGLFSAIGVLRRKLIKA